MLRVILHVSKKSMHSLSIRSEWIKIEAEKVWLEQPNYILWASNPGPPVLFNSCLCAVVLCHPVSGMIGSKRIVKGVNLDDVSPSGADRSSYAALNNLARFPGRSTLRLTLTLTVTLYGWTSAVMKTYGWYIVHAMAIHQHLPDEQRSKCPDDRVTKLACAVRLWAPVVCMGIWSYVRVFWVESS